MRNTKSTDDDTKTTTTTHEALKVYFYLEYVRINGMSRSLQCNVSSKHMIFARDEQRMKERGMGYIIIQASQLPGQAISLLRH